MAEQKTITSEDVEIIQKALDVYYKVGNNFLSYDEGLNLKNQIYDVLMFLKYLKSSGLVTDERGEDDDRW